MSSELRKCSSSGPLTQFALEKSAQKTSALQRGTARNNSGETIAAVDRRDRLGDNAARAGRRRYRRNSIFGGNDERFTGRVSCERSGRRRRPRLAVVVVGESATFRYRCISVESRALYGFAVILVPAHAASN
ncbi:hypothetical protein EVAR_63363_1 [Eumeta japonica]|uniref:Uncharacterized protein n=1 Tax=Eumeta variegata TaxID=151549 RepID=A0A4C1ZWG5_EUMVA|nr:hypothetical protein EVAR_63363_1 [Eumeta japonica]